MEPVWDATITRCTDCTYLVQFLEDLPDGGLRRAMHTFPDFDKAVMFLANHFAEYDFGGANDLSRL